MGDDKKDGGFTGNAKGVRYVIAFLLALFAAGGLGWCQRADAQQLEGAVWDKDRTSISYGLPFIGGQLCEFTSLTVAREFYQRKARVGFTTHGEGQCKGEFVDANFRVFALHQQFLGRGGHWSIGFGAALSEHGDIGIGNETVLDDVTEPRKAFGIQLSAVISVRTYWLRHRLVVDLPLHLSVGGSTRFNPGWNFLQVGYRF